SASSANAQQEQRGRDAFLPARDRRRAVAHGAVAGGAAAGGRGVSAAMARAPLHRPEMNRSGQGSGELGKRNRATAGVPLPRVLRAMLYRVGGLLWVAGARGLRAPPLFLPS